MGKFALLWCDLTLYCCESIFRMAKAESVQYFQFDQTGNLYVYEPGAGCSGPCVKVEPGFEMGEICEGSVLSGDVWKSSCLSDAVTSVSSTITETSQLVIEPTPQIRLL